jgi:hypothetical protein
MKETQPNPANFCDRIDLNIPLIGFYDAPDPSAFEPLVKPSPGECVFAFYAKWAEGKTLHIIREHYGCGGAGQIRKSAYFDWTVERRSMGLPV